MFARSLRELARAQFGSQWFSRRPIRLKTDIMSVCEPLRQACAVLARSLRGACAELARAGFLTNYVIPCFR